jgi:hypothetical protein
MELFELWTQICPQRVVAVVVFAKPSCVFPLLVTQVYHALIKCFCRIVNMIAPPLLNLVASDRVRVSSTVDSVDEFLLSELHKLMDWKHFRNPTRVIGQVVHCFVTYELVFVFSMDGNVSGHNENKQPKDQKPDGPLDQHNAAVTASRFKPAQRCGVE